MAHGKLYRNFIILQEDERGHSTAQDKPLSGYAKVEAKDDRCKVSFYAQNLKKDEHKCYMLIICAKKEMRQLMNLGEVNITDIGKVDGYKEFTSNNIGGLGIGYDKISGAAICKKVDDKLMFLISGFMSNELPKDDWKQYPVLNSMDLGKFVGNNNGVKQSTTSQTNMMNDNSTVPMGASVGMNQSTMVQTPSISQTIPEVGSQNQQLNEGMEGFPMYQDAVPTLNAGTTIDSDESQQGNTLSQQTDDMSMYDTSTSQQGTMPMNNMSTSQTGSVPMYNSSIPQMMGSGSNIMNTSNKPLYGNSTFNVPRGIGEAVPPTVDDDTIEVRSEFDDYETKIGEEIKQDDFRPVGSVGEFFESLAEDFEVDRHKNKKKDIKYCKWYKVPINNLDEMCNIADYNKYTVIYYPMINYYPYFKKHGHYCIGYKCNEKGNMKYIVYGIPGKKDKGDQPYGGKTGFVTWMEDEALGRDMGYWLMFYDFRNSVIVIPAEG